MKRRDYLRSIGEVSVALSLIGNWWPPWDTTDDLEERVEQLEEQALAAGPLDDRPRPTSTGIQHYLALDDRMISTVVDGEWDDSTALGAHPEPTAVGAMFFTENETPTTFDAEGEWEPVAGESVAGELERYTHLESENQLRYDGSERVKRRVIVTMAVQTEGNAANTEHELAVFNNGEFVDTRKQIEIDQDDDIEHVTLANIIEFEPDELMYPALRCTDGTDGLVVLNMSMTIY